MGNLEEILALEERLNGGLLYDNYKGLTETNGKECTQLVIRYIGLVETVSGKNFDFVKKLTKVGDHISDKLDYKDLEKLYRFNHEGIILANGLLNERETDHISRVKAHLFACAGNAARRLFEKNKHTVSWAERWYECYENSAKMAEKSEPRHAGFAYSFAGDAAGQLFEKTKKLEWLEREYNCFLASAQILKTVEPEQAIQAYDSAGGAARRIYKETKSITALEQSLRCNLSAASYYGAWNDAKELRIKTFSTKWLWTVIDSYEKYISLSKKKNRSPDNHQAESSEEMNKKLQNMKNELQGWLPEIR